MKLEKLKSRVAALLATIPTAPTFEEFKAKWADMGELDKALYIGMAECPALFGVELDKDDVSAAICQYLKQMGFVSENVDLQTLIGELESERNE